MLLLDKCLGTWQIFPMFWIAVAAQVADAMPNRDRVLSLLSADVPVSLIEESAKDGVVENGAMRRVGIRVIIKPDGGLLKCETEFTSGVSELDAYTCKLIRKRARFLPSHLSGGSPAYGVVRTTVTWAINARPLATPADLELSVNQLPVGVKSPAYVQVVFDVDEKGQPSSCAAETTRATPKANLVLVPIACEQIQTRYRAIPTIDESGRLVPSVQDASVSFTEERK